MDGNTAAIPRANISAAADKRIGSSEAPPVGEMALFTLTQMAAGGIVDQLGGSFYRYSVDAQCAIPHFEKMLYDNGPLLGLFADAWQRTGQVRFKTLCEETVGWVQRLK